MNLPQKDWYWQFNHQQNRLVICSDNQVCYVTGLRQAQLTGDAMARQMMGLDELAFLNEAYEVLSEQCEMDEGVATHYAMTAVSARRFFKPVQPQSWYFLASSAQLTLSDLMLVELDTAESQGIFLILSQDESTALIMLVSEELVLSEHKTMMRGEVMRVMEDRVARYASNSSIKGQVQQLRA